MIEDRVGGHGHEQADEAADHRPERQHHADDQGAEVPGHAGGHRRQITLGLDGEVAEGDRQEHDRFPGQPAGEGRQEQVNRAEGQPDRAADREDPPAPRALAGGGFLFLHVLRQGHDALRADRRHREGQLLHVAGGPEERVADEHDAQLADDELEDHQGDRHEPVHAEETALAVGSGIGRRRKPGGNLPGQAEGGRGLAAREELVPEQSAGAAGGGGHHGAGHEEEDEDFRAFELLLGAAGHLDEEDHGDPLRRRPDPLAGQQAHVDGPGHHEEADEDRSGQGGPVEPFLEGGRRRHRAAEFLQLPVLFFDGFSHLSALVLLRCRICHSCARCSAFFRYESIVSGASERQMRNCLRRSSRKSLLRRCQSLGSPDWRTSRRATSSIPGISLGR